jgi:hypothetical protein
MTKEVTALLSISKEVTTKRADLTFHPGLDKARHPNGSYKPLGKLFQLAPRSSMDRRDGALTNESQHHGKTRHSNGS